MSVPGEGNRLHYGKAGNMQLDRYDKRYMRMAMPASLESLFMILLSSADLIMVGVLGAISVAAVSIFLQPRLVLLCFSRSLASALTLMTANAREWERKERATDFLKKTVTVTVVLLGILHLLFALFFKEILILMGATPDYLGEAMIYGEISLIAVFFTSLTVVLQAVQLGFGQTDVIMKTNISGNIVNIIVNALLIFGLGPFPKMGVAGAAIGTVIGTLFTLLYTAIILKKDGFFEGGSWMPTAEYRKKFLPIFTSIFTEQGSERIGMVLFARMAAGLGTIPFAVHSICMNICDIYWDFATGMGKASMVLAGQTYNEDKEKWTIYRNRGLKWWFIFSTFAFIVTIMFREEIFGFYSSDPLAIEMGTYIMLFIAFVSYPEALALICAGILRGSGKTAQVASYSFVSVAILRPLTTAFFLYVMGLGITGVWIALVLDQMIRATCSVFLMLGLHDDHDHPRSLASISD